MSEVGLDDPVLASHTAAVRIFICYRRDDSGILTGRLFDRLSSRFGGDHVFLDSASIGSGVAFRERIATELRRSTVVIAVIGDRWAGATDIGRRIDDPQDLVRIELETAIALGRPIVPIYVHRTPFKSEDLPPSLRPITERNAVVLAPSDDFDVRTRTLVRDLWRLNDTSLGRRVRARVLNFWLRRRRSVVMATALGIAVWGARDWLAGMMLSDTGLARALARYDPMAFRPGRSGTAHVARMFVDRQQLIEDTDLVASIATCRTTLDVFAITGSAFLNNAEVLRAARDRGIKVRVLLLDHSRDNTENVERLFALSKEPGLGTEWSIRNFVLAVNRFRTLGIELKVWRGPLLHSFWIRDGGDPSHAIGHVELTYFGDVRANPSLRVGALAAPLVTSLQSQFDYMWNLPGVAVAPP